MSISVRSLVTSAQIILLLAGALNTACSSSNQESSVSTSPATSPVAENNNWNTFVSDYIESYFKAHPEAAVYAGRHEFDGKLSDWSADGLRSEIARLHSLRDKTTGFTDTTLDAGQRFERDYLLARIDGDLFWLEKAEWPYRNPQFYADAIDPDVYISRNYAPLDVRMRAYINYAKAVPTAISQIKSNLRTPLPRTLIKIGRTSIGGLAAAFEKDVPSVFASVKDEQLQEEFRAANALAITAVKDFDAWLKAQEASATDNFALGADLFSEMLRSTERVDIPLDQLEEIGKKDMERNLAALRTACAEYAPGKTVPECMEKAASDKPQGSAVEAARNQLGDLKKFIIDNNIVTIAGTEEAQVNEAPPYRRWNFAYINIPGPYEKGLPSVYYISPPDPTWSKEKRDGYVPGKMSLLFTSVHEVWPGHFLQFLHSNRSQSKFGQIFVGYAFAEGWAHYTEEMMSDAGLGGGSAEAHIGQLQEALLRNARFLSAIGMHARGMKVEESERMFREEAYQDGGTAQQQAERGTFDPAYLNYTLGKLMIRKLREDWTATHGGRAGWKEFHDQFLKFGGPPIPLVRTSMLGTNSGSLF